MKYKNEPYSIALHHRLVSQSGIRAYGPVWRGCSDNPHQPPSEQGGRAETEVVAFNCIPPNLFWDNVNRYRDYFGADQGRSSHRLLRNSAGDNVAVRHPVDKTDYQNRLETIPAHMEPCCDHTTGNPASLFSGFEFHLYDAVIFVPQLNTLETLRHSMNKNEQTNIPLKPFMKVAMAPVVVFALANALFLPLVDAFFNFSNRSFLANLVASTNNPFIQGFILIVASLCFLPLSAAAVLIGPALTSFFVNLKYPILTSRSGAILCGGVFLFFYTILLDVLLIFRFIENVPSIYSNYMALS